MREHVGPWRASAPLDRAPGGDEEIARLSAVQG
jgi:hypothetical protein